MKKTDDMESPAVATRQRKFEPEDRVRILLAKGSISQDVYLVEEDKNSGDIKLIRENTIQRDPAGAILKGVRVLVNSARVFPHDMDQQAPVVHTAPDEAVAHCPTCGEQHAVTVGDSQITCSKHGVFPLYRTKEHVARAKKPTVSEKPKAKDKKPVDSTITQPAPTAAVAAFNADDVKAMGELWTKRLEFDYSHVDARGYILFIDINGVLHKHCFNTYNGLLGKKAGDNDINKFRNPKGAYPVKDVDKAREQISAKGYTLVG